MQCISRHFTLQYITLASVIDKREDFLALLCTLFLEIEHKGNSAPSITTIQLSYLYHSSLFSLIKTSTPHLWSPSLVHLHHHLYESLMLFSICFTLSLESTSRFSPTTSYQSLYLIFWSSFPWLFISIRKLTTLIISITPLLFHSRLKTYLFRKSRHKPFPLTWLTYMDS